MKESIRMIKKMALACLHSVMEESMKGSGKMANNMEEASSRRRTSLDKVFGKMVRGLDGPTKQKKTKEISLRKIYLDLFICLIY